jgi:hypothetical protein
MTIAAAATNTRRQRFISLTPSLEKFGRRNMRRLTRSPSPLLNSSVKRWTIFFGNGYGPQRAICEFWENFAGELAGKF